MSNSCQSCKYGGEALECPSECYNIFDRTDEDYTGWSPKLCIECIHFEVIYSDEPCDDCRGTEENKNWEPIPDPEPEPEPEDKCETCRWGWDSGLSCPDGDCEVNGVYTSWKPIKPNDLLTDKPEPENEIDKQLKEIKLDLASLSISMDNKVDKICESCYYNEYDAEDCPDECFEDPDLSINKGWRSLDLAEELNDFTVEVQAALADMEKGLLRMQERTDNIESNQTILLGRVNILGEKSIPEPDPIRSCSNCLYDVKDGFKGHEDCPGDCRGYNEWKPNVRGN